MKNKNKPQDSDSFLGKFPPLTPENIDFVEKEVNEDQTYGDEANDKELVDYFTLKGNALNNNRNIFLHKIFLIDYTNSTNLYRQKKKIPVFTLADRITKIKDLDNRIREGNIDVVQELAKQEVVLYPGDKVSDKPKEVNILSFASKYCLYHNRLCYGKDHYSIYDGVVAFVIAPSKYFKGYLPDVSQNVIKKIRECADYKSFHELISRIIKEYQLEGKIKGDIRRKLDHFLWYPNKKFFYSLKNKNKTNSSSKNE